MNEASQTQSQTARENYPSPTMMELLADLTPLNRVVCSSDYDRTIEYLKSVLPVTEISYPDTEQHNGWVIPPKWDVIESTISRDGRLLYDGTWHPMATIALSAPFKGKVTLAELKRHLHFDHRYDDVIPFHFRQLFRSWDRSWGFSVPKRFYDSLEDGDYDVVIETRESPGTLRMLEWDLQGETEETFVFGANLDHPGVANDGLSGVVVGIELFRELAKRPRRFSYRLVLTQGIIGSEYYLGLQDPERRSQLFEGVMLEMIGSRTQLAMQYSRSGSGNLESALAEALRESGIDHRTGAFEEVVLNDEYIWEAYGIPMASLTRFPYPEYHTDKDDLDAVSEERLREAVDVLLAGIEKVEETSLIFKRFEGNVCLSNPSYDLYIDPGQIAFGDKPDEQRRRMRLLMDTIPSLTRPISVGQLARTVGLPPHEVSDYVNRWVDKGLLELRPGKKAGSSAPL